MSTTTTLDGHFLIAMPGMGDERFERTVIYICAHSEEGAMGFVINKRLARPSISDFFQQLEIIEPEEQILVPESVSNQSLHMGGPVEPGRGFVLHSSEFASDTTLVVNHSVGLTATLEILRAIAMGTGPQKTLLALGYAGWSPGKLEEEIASNGWLTCEADLDILFDANDDAKYEKSLRSMGVDPLLLSASAGHA